HISKRKDAGRDTEPQDFPILDRPIEIDTLEIAGSLLAYCAANRAGKALIFFEVDPGDERVLGVWNSLLDLAGGEIWVDLATRRAEESQVNEAGCETEISGENGPTRSTWRLDISIDN